MLEKLKEDMNVLAMFITSSDIYYLVIEHATSVISYYCKVDMSSSSVQYMDLPITSSLKGAYLSPFLKLYFGDAELITHLIGGGTEGYTNSVGFIMNFDQTYSCLELISSFHSQTGVSWISNAFAYNSVIISLDITS